MLFICLYRKVVVWKSYLQYILFSTVKNTCNVFRFPELTVMKIQPYLCKFALVFAIAAVGCKITPTESLVSYPEMGSIERIDPALEYLIPADAVLEKLADGFEWTEGPVWRPDSAYLLFTDIPTNTIYKWSEVEGLSIFLRPSGYPFDHPSGAELGSNGLMLDADGSLVMCDHGNRAIARLNEDNFTKTILAGSFQGKRFNSPNDLIFKSNGDLYFTDPPYGLEGQDDSQDKELEFNGVYLLSTDGEVTILTDELTRPNGIAFSPDEKTLYVANSDPVRSIWMAYDVLEDGTLQNGRVFFDATSKVEEGLPGLPDGMTIDHLGNVFATGPGGVLVFSPDGTHLGTINTGEATANCTFGDDGATLYVTADMYLARIKLTTMGLGF